MFQARGTVGIPLSLEALFTVGMCGSLSSTQGPVRKSVCPEEPSTGLYSGYRRGKTFFFLMWS